MWVTNKKHHQQYTKLVDDITLLDHVTNDLSCLRPNALKAAAKPEYKALTLPAIGHSQYLFGSDFTKELKDAEESSKKNRRFLKHFTVYAQRITSFETNRAHQTSLLTTEEMIFYTKAAHDPRSENETSTSRKITPRASTANKTNEMPRNFRGITKNSRVS